MSLRTRLALVVGAVVVLAVASASTAAYYVMGRQLDHSIDQFLLDRSSRPDGGRGGPRGGLPDPDGLGLDAIVQQLDRDGTIVASTGPLLPVDDRDRAIAADPRSPSLLRTVEVSGTRYRMITSAEPGGARQIARSLAENDRVLDETRLRLLLIGLAGTALAVVAALVIARRTTKPIVELTAAAERVTRTGDLSTPIDTTGDDEVGRLAASFTAMLGALAESKRQQQRLVQDASHELRTPLTSLRANGELLSRFDQLPPEDRAALIADVQSETGELEALVAELVELATDHRLAEPSQRVDLGEVVARVGERVRRRTGRDLEVHLERPAVVDVRLGQLERAVSNVMENACKFSPEGTPVEVRVQGSTFSVRDHGPGIPPDDLPRVFDRFHRATAARTLPGSGLGLAIVKQFADDHGGTVSAVNAAGGGAEVGFTLVASRTG